MAAFVPQFHIDQKATYTVYSLSTNIGAGNNFDNAILIEIKQVIDFGNKTKYWCFKIKF